jgi:hypothetical protein
VRVPAETFPAAAGRSTIARSWAWQPIAIAFALAFLFVFAAPRAFANQLILNSTGGTATLGTDVKINGSTVANPAGTLSIDCPITTISSGTYAIIYNCSAGSFTYQSTDGTTAVSAPFGTAALTLTASGGGKGGNIHYYYSFAGNFSGTETVNGVAGAIKGEANASIGPLSAKIGTGSATACCVAAGVNSAYTPLYVSDYSFSQLVRSDDLWGANKQVFGGTGTGVNQFYGPHGVTVDGSGRIYVVDTFNCRIVRMNDITGAGWTTFGTCGSGTGQFSTAATDITLDAGGKIYVVDTGNNRVVRIDDMVGTNWTTLGNGGSATNLLSGPQGVAVDAAGKIYVADSANSRIVRVEDITGTNWTTLKQSPVINGYIYSFASPAHVALDPTGRIVVGDGSKVIRVDDMTGANWTWTNVSTTIAGLSVDDSGTTFVAGSGSGLAIIDDIATGAGFDTSNLVTQPGGIYAVPVPAPVPAVTVAPSTLTYANQNIGTTSASQNVVLTNFGEAPLSITKIGTVGDFAETDNCGTSLPGGSNCTVAVTYVPTATGKASGTLTISDNAFTGTQTVALAGTGTAPVGSITPTSLAFQPQEISTTSGGQVVVLSNSGTGPLTFAGTGIAVSGDFAQTNNCGTAVAPHTSCAITAAFTPTTTAAEAGSLTVTSNAIPLTVSLTGTGVSAAPQVTASPESLNFPTELVANKSAPQAVTLKNSGTTATPISGTAVSGDFAIAATNCGTSLGAGKSCLAYVTFTSTTAGARTGALTFTLASGAGTVGLAGTGTATATGWLTFSPTALVFNGYVVGDNPNQLLTVTNTNSVPVGIKGIGKSGSTAFTFTKTCGTLLAASASCTVNVTFIPTTVGSYSGTLYVVESAGTLHSIALSGTGVTGN